jgi:peptidoglycan hydrolase CwlO-like protein
MIKKLALLVVLSVFVTGSSLREANAYGECNCDTSFIEFDVDQLKEKQFWINNFLDETQEDIESISELRENQEQLENRISNLENEIIDITRMLKQLIQE